MWKLLPFVMIFFVLFSCVGRRMAKMQKELDYANAKIKIRALERNVAAMKDSINFLKDSIHTINKKIGFVRDSAKHEVMILDSLMKRREDFIVSHMEVTPANVSPPLGNSLAWLTAENETLLTIIKVLLINNDVELNKFLSKERNLGTYEIAHRRIQFILYTIR